MFKKIKLKYFFKYYIIITKLFMEHIHNYKVMSNRHNKLLNDYKKEQRILN